VAVVLDEIGGAEDGVEERVLGTMPWPRLKM